MLCIHALCFLFVFFRKMEWMFIDKITSKAFYVKKVTKQNLSPLVFHTTHRHWLKSKCLEKNRKICDKQVDKI
jgi:hypothetical protein